VALGNWLGSGVTEPGSTVGLTWLQAVISNTRPIKVNPKEYLFFEVIVRSL
jgi:hypothetical protein